MSYMYKQPNNIADQPTHPLLPHYLLTTPLYIGILYYFIVRVHFLLLPRESPKGIKRPSDAEISTPHKCPRKSPPKISPKEPTQDPPEVYSIIMTWLLV